MYGIVNPEKSHQEFRRGIQLAALKDQLADNEIEGICRDIGHLWRRRELPPGVMVRSMVYRGLSPDRSIAAVLADMASGLGGQADAPTDSAWCQARSRLPEAVLTELTRRQARRTRRRFGGKHLWHGRPIFIVDGSTVSMPDTPVLAEAFGRIGSKHGPSRFPVARITFIELAGLEVIWDYRLEECRCDENTQFRMMWHTLPRGCICLFDRYLSSFYTLAKLRNRRIGVVSRLHGRRDPQRLIRTGRPIGPDQWLVPLDLARTLRARYDDPALPKVLWVRLIRHIFRRGQKRHVLWLVTTLMDPVRYPRGEVADLYRRR